MALKDVCNLSLCKKVIVRFPYTIDPSKLTSVILIHLKEVQVDVSNNAGRGSVLEKVDALWITERKNEDERGNDDGKPSVVIKCMTK